MTLLNPFALVNSILCIPLLNCPSTTQRVSTSSTAPSASVTTGTTSQAASAPAISSAVVASPVITAQNAKYWPGWSGIDNIFAFGNSYTTTEFNPAGPQPSKENPIGNPPFPGKTSSGGLNWLGYLTGVYNESQVLTYNMASGGATVDADLVKPFVPSVLSLKQQVEQGYIPKYGDRSGGAQWKSGNTLHSFWIGINDVGNSYLLPDVDETKLLPQIFAQFTSLVEEVYKTGARNFLFINVPPVNRSPITKAQANIRAPDLEGTAIISWNTLLIQMVSKLQITHPDVTTFIFDANLMFTAVLDNPKISPQTSELKNTTGFCAAYQNGTPQRNTLAPGCGVPVNEYFWLNALHPTPAIHDLAAVKIIAQMKLTPKSLLYQPDLVGGTSTSASASASADAKASTSTRAQKRDDHLPVLQSRSRILRRSHRI